MFVDSAEASRQKAADAASAAAAAAEVRSSVGQSSHETHAAAGDVSAYNHTGADDSPKPHASSGRPGPGGGGGGVSRVIGAAEAAERDKFNSDKRNEVRLNTPHSGANASVSGVKGRSPAKGSPGQHRGKSDQALSPFEQAYATRPCMYICIYVCIYKYIYVYICMSGGLLLLHLPTTFVSQGAASKFCRPDAAWPTSNRGTPHMRCSRR